MRSLVYLATLALGLGLSQPAFAITAPSSVGYQATSQWTNGGQTFCQIRFSGEITGTDNDTGFGRDRYAFTVVNSQGADALAPGAASQFQVGVGQTNPIVVNAETSLFDAGTTYTLYETDTAYNLGAVVATYTFTQADVDAVWNSGVGGCRRAETATDDSDDTDETDIADTGGVTGGQCIAFGAAEQTGWGACGHYGGRTVDLEYREKVASPGDFYLYGNDNPGGSRLCSAAGNPLHGNWFANGDCAEICFDAKLFKDGDGNDAQDSPLSMVVKVWGGSTGSLSANYKFTQTLSDNGGQGSDWTRFCAPLKKAEPGEGPSDGWTLAGAGSTAPDVAWNDLFNNVTKVELPLDNVRKIEEEIGYDNICLSGQTCGETKDSLLEKTCEKTGDTTALCRITVTPGVPLPQSLMVAEVFTAAGLPINTQITSITSTDPWSCTAVPVASGSDPVSCVLSGANMVAGQASTLEVALDLLPGQTELRNCASGEALIAGTVSPALREACAEIEDVPPPTPQACTAFEAEVSCDTENGGYQVVLKNTAAGFDPDDLSVTPLTGGISLMPGATSGNKFFSQLTGAQPGQTIRLDIAAMEAAGGSRPGLDLCCMGEIEVTIPEGLICEPPPPREITVEKTCRPSDNPALGNTMCSFDLTYSGPAPDAAHPITLTDAQASGPAMQFEHHFDPILAHDWQCPNGPAPLPVSCTLSTADVSGPVDWSNFTSTLDVFLTTGENWRNCVQAAAGESTAEACFENEEEEGTPDLEIAKDGPEICARGTICTFTLTVTNVGSGAYNGPIQLGDTAGIAGTTGIYSPAGNLVSITPAVCPVSDLVAGVCADTVSLAPGATQTYTVEYVPPPVQPVFGPSPPTYPMRNCATLSDSTFTTEDTPQTVDGHEACTDFELRESSVSVEKVMTEGCVPGQTCSFEIKATATGGPYSGRILILEGMNANNAVGQITSITGAPTPLPSSCVLNGTQQDGCVLDLSLNAGESQVWTVTGGFAGIGDTLEMGENCATLIALPASVPVGSIDIANPPAELALVGGGALLGQSCVPLTPPPSGGNPEVAVEKSCGPALRISDLGVYAFTISCRITVSADGPLTAPISLSEVLSGPNGVASDKITAFTSADPWACPALPLGASDAAACTLAAADMPASGVSQIDVELRLFAGDENGAWDNCAEIGNAKSCAPIVFPRLEVTKVCTPDVVTITGPETSLDCTITVTGENLPPATPVTFTDELTKSGAGTMPIIEDMQASGVTGCVRSASDVLGCLLTTDAIMAPGGVTIPVTVMLDPSGPVTLKNCASASLHAEFTARGCDDVQLVDQTAMPRVSRSSVTMVKNCTPLAPANANANGTTSYPTTCTLSFSAPNLAANEVLTIWDQISDATMQGTLSGTGNCALDPNGAHFACQTVASAVQSAPGGVATITLTGTITVQAGVTEVRNCGGISVNSDTADMALSCTDIAVPPSNAPPQPSLNITKTCGTATQVPGVVGGAGPTYPYQCTIRLSGTNLAAGQVVDLRDTLIPSQTFVHDPAGGFAPANGLLSCAPIATGAGQPLAHGCQVSTDALIAAGGTLAFTYNGGLLDQAGIGTQAEAQNCVQAAYWPTPQQPLVQSQQACAPVPVAMHSAGPLLPGPAAYPLIAVKSSTGACEVDAGARQYRCAFDLGVQNTSAEAFTGAIVLEDRFDGARPTDVTISEANGWDCIRPDGSGTSCSNGALRLAPGQEARFGMRLTLPGTESGGTFKNCARAGISDSRYQRASIIQRALQSMGIDGGPVDGSPGRKTREGVQELQKRLNLEATGEIDDGLFAALGIPLASVQPEACAVVDLPPIPRPKDPDCQKGSTFVPGKGCVKDRVRDDKPKDCPRGTTRNSRGVCINAPKDCPRGSVLNSKGDCVKREEPRLSCDRATTVARGGECLCRYDGMRKTSKTSCGCTRGSVFVPGAGCRKVKIDINPRGNSDDGAAGTESCRIKINGICLK